MREIKLQNIDICRQMLVLVKDLYFNSFPPEERRSWESVKQLLQADSTAYDLKVVLLNDKFAGFITSWIFGDFCYVEHFAVDSQLCGNGIGAEAIRHFVAQCSCPVVLEVELPQEGEMARRRIDFYKRNGFVEHRDFKYIQPPYDKGLSSVPLMLMTANAPHDISLQHVSKCLHRDVYGVKD